MNNKEIKKLTELMGKSIDEKIVYEIKKNNKKMFHYFGLFIQITIMLIVIYLEFNKR